jgi:hypothetical protein
MFMIVETRSLKEQMMPVVPDNPVTTPDAPSHGAPEARRDSRSAEPADPVERADRRRENENEGDVSVERDGTVKQKPHGNMDETLVPKGKDHPEQGPYPPEHDGIDPDLAPDDKA